MEEHETNPANRLTILLVFVAIFVGILTINSQLGNSYRGHTAQEECERQSCAGFLGCNVPLYNQCLREMKPVFDCLGRNPNDQSCWGRQGKSTRT